MKITQTKFTRNNMDRNEHETPSEKLKYLQCWPLEVVQNCDFLIIVKKM